MQSARPPDYSAEDDGLFRDELFWRDHYTWLEGCGYLLRPRYYPKWIPSWHKTNKDSDECEDGQSTLYTTIMDATCVSDGTIVAIKRLKKSQNPLEADIVQSFSQSSLAGNPKNHTVPILHVLRSPYEVDTTLLVMPYLVQYEKIPFETVGEVAEFFRQLLEGLQFIHENHIAHRDIMTSNIMMEPSVYSEAPHPIVKSRSYDFKRPVKRGSRTERPPKYYYTDFGISCRLPADAEDPREDPILGGDRSVPEHQRLNGPQNPYRTDVYCLGNTFRTQFLWKYSGLDFLAPLVESMVQDTPQARPTIAEACSHFSQLVQASRPRSRVIPRGENAVVGLFRAWRHASRTGIYVITKKPALPIPDSTVQRKPTHHDTTPTSFKSDTPEPASSKAAQQKPTLLKPASTKSVPTKSPPTRSATTPIPTTTATSASTQPAAPKRHTSLPLYYTPTARDPTSSKSATRKSFQVTR